MPSPDTTRSLILVLAVAGFASTFAGRTVDPLVTLVAQDLAAPVTTVALLAAAFTFPYAFIQPVLGPVGDAVGKLRIMQACLLVLTVSLAASVFVTSLDLLFALRIVAGAAAGGVIPLALATLGDRVGIGERQVAISRFLVAVIVGQLAGSSLSGLIGEAIGWRGVFALAAGLAAAAFLATGARVRSNPEAGRAFSLGGALQRYRVLLRTPRALALFSLVFVEAMGTFGIFPFIAPLLEERGAGGPAQAGLALAGFAVGGLIYSACVRWLLRVLGLSRMLVAGGLICAAALALVAVAHDWRVFGIALVVLGTGFYMLHNSFQTQVTELSPEARASAVALHAFSFFLGQALGVVVIGAGLHTLGQGPTLAACAVVMGVLGAVAAWALWVTRPTAA